MATRTATKSGFMSDTTVWGAAAPVAGDTIVLAGFTIYADYSVALANITSVTGSTIIPINGNIQLTVTAFTATNPLIIQGGPAYVENTNGTPAGLVAKGTGGV
jgi:hypothetical protein